MMSRRGWFGIGTLDRLSSATGYQLACHVLAGVTLLTAVLVSNVASEISSLIGAL